MRLRLFPFLLLLAGLLQSCGGFTTIVSVYPDGSAELQYEIEAPVGKMPDFERMGQGDWSDLFKKDQYLSQEPGKLMDSLMRFTIAPLLIKLQNRGQIRHFSIKDTMEFTNKKVNISIQLRSYEDAGRVHSAFRREAPVLDSILRKLTGRSARSQNDSIAIVKLDDSLELQIHHFITSPEPEGTREERVENGKKMMDSLILLFSDSESVFTMMGDEGQKMIDSMKIMRPVMTDDQFDSLGALASMSSSMKELFRPKIVLKAPVYLTDNREEAGLYAVNVTPKEGGLEFEPGMFYDQQSVTTEPFRQRFKLSLPSKTSMMIRTRDEWRSIMRWCDECEAGFAAVPSKATTGLTFHEVKNKAYLVEVDCGSANKNNVRLFYMLDESKRMPAIALHQFPIAMYTDDPAYELRSGSPHFVKRMTDLLVGKINYNKATNILTVDRGNAKEVFEVGNNAPYLRSAQYKDKAGKWLKYDDYISGSDLFTTSSCVEGVQNSSALMNQDLPLPVSEP